MKKFTQAALVADALNLGPHWIYNQGKLARLYPDGVTTFTDPASSFHPNRKAGQLTHIGEQVLFLQQSIEENNSQFDLEKWRAFWLEKLSNYDGFIDSATKVTLQTSAQEPSNSDEISVVARVAPLLDLDLPLEQTIQAARSQTTLTHGAPEVVEVSEFMVQAVTEVQQGKTFREALQMAAQTVSSPTLDAATHLQKALDADPQEHLKVAADFGLTCHFPEAFPLMLYYAVHHGEQFEDCLSKNALAGGDNAARAILLSLLFVARDGQAGVDLFPKLQLETTHEQLPLVAGANHITIPGAQGNLSGVLELPADYPAPPKATAIFAHCFTCGKDFLPEKRITQGLAKHGIATLRIDFAGVGTSEGSFSDSSYLTNLDDLREAAQWLEKHLSAPALLVGHSLGGAAVLAVAKSLPSVKAVATIGAPADPSHVTHLFEDHLPEIEEQGQATIKLAGRPFTIGKRFLDDLRDFNQQKTLSQLHGISTLIMHSPEDQTVPLENAGQIYSALPHPKSFIALAGTDHLLTKPADAQYVVDLIETWSSRALTS